MRDKASDAHSFRLSARSVLARVGRQDALRVRDRTIRGRAVQRCHALSPHNIDEEARKQFVLGHRDRIVGLAPCIAYFVEDKEGLILNVD